jgi:hypothetical protein
MRTDVGRAAVLDSQIAGLNYIADYNDEQLGTLLNLISANTREMRHIRLKV